MGQTASFKRPDGKDCNGYLASPASSDKAPGVVVIQEWWGLNDQIKGVAERLASLGYRALVPDLYKGKVALDVAEQSARIAAGFQRLGLQRGARIAVLLVAALVLLLAAQVALAAQSTVVLSVEGMT